MKKLVFVLFLSVISLHAFSQSPELIRWEKQSVIVKPFNRVHIKNGNDGVYIESNFKCEKGATFEVK